MKNRLLKIFCIILSLFTLLSPLCAFAQTEDDFTPDVPLPCDFTVTDDALTLFWEKPQNAEGCELWQFSFSDLSNVTCVYSGDAGEFALSSIPENEVCYTLRSYSTVDENKVYSAFSELTRVKKQPVFNITPSFEKISMNVGATRKFDVSFDVDYSDICYLPEARFSSDDSDIARIDAETGKITAVSAGKCTVTCEITGGYSVSCAVTVNSNISLKDNFRFEKGEALSLPDQLLGKDNRINGKILSDAPMTKLVVTILNDKSATELSLTKKLNSGVIEYDLSDLSRSIRFSDLKSGKKTLRVTAYIAQGGAKVYEKRFTVNKTAPKGSAAGKSIAAFAKTRIGDPFSTSKRATGKYVDSSYLVNWSVMQALGKRSSTTAAEQYRSCENNKRTLKYSSLRAGDLIFYGSTSRKSYKGIWQVAIYIGDGKSVLATSGGVEVVPAAKGSRIYYGRPY